MTRGETAAHFDAVSTAIVVESLTIADTDVVREAQHWTTGRRGPVVEDPSQLAGCDLSAFATEAILLGARALAATAQTSEVRLLEHMLKEVGDKTAAASTNAAKLTELAVKDASTVVVRVANDAKKAITEADEQSRKEFTTAVQGAKNDLTAEIRRLVGGEAPELLERLQPVLDKFGAGLETQVRTSTRELLDRAAKQFDPTDPSSPMAKHAAALTAQQEKVTQQIEKNHGELATKVDELTTILKVQQAKSKLASVTPIKGGSFEEQIHDLLRGMAAALGDEYVDTTAKIGFIPRSKKGDGVLTAAGTTHVVLEMTDSSRSGWGDYFDEAERNRSAVASIGIVRTPEQNGHQAIRVLGPRRVVLAFNPERDDPELLRTVVLLVRTVALAATSRTGSSEVATAEEKIGEALAQLDKIAKVKKLASSIQKSAGTIDGECTSLSASIRRLLDEALVALAGTPTAQAHLADLGTGAA
ncbi:hypothetical protein ACWEOO_22115 [Kribbella sp. NPDC004138]